MDWQLTSAPKASIHSKQNSLPQDEHIQDFIKSAVEHMSGINPVSKKSFGALHTTLPQVTRGCNSLRRNNMLGS
jgi:hypothetical protein